jgi:hypothetical protein
MTARLHALAGGHELLLDGGRVQRVWTEAAIAGNTLAWEGGDLPLVDLVAMLGRNTPSTTARVIVVYGQDKADAIALAVDEVRGLVTLGLDGVAALPALSPPFALLFDAIAVEPVEGRHPLCVRTRLNAASLVATSSALAAAGGRR